MNHKPTPNTLFNPRFRRVLALTALLLAIAAGGLLRCQSTQTNHEARLDARLDTSQDIPQPVTLAQTELNELSGLAASPSNASVLWGINDSGNASNLYAIDKHTGADLGHVRLEGVVNVDWEDLASFSLDGRSWLLIADVGDNRAVRQLVHLWLVSEPVANSENRYSGSIQPKADIAYVYPEGARDSESVDVDTRNQQIVIISKREPLPRVYRLPLVTSTPDSVLTAEFLGEVPELQQPTLSDELVFGQYASSVSQTTALSIRDLADGGQQALLLTYKQAYLYSKQAGQGWGEVFAQKPTIIAMPRLPQAEALSFDQNENLFWLTSEQLPTPLYAIPLPE